MVKNIAITTENGVMWNVNATGEKEFAGGRNDWKNAATEAGRCRHFSIDVEEELASDEEISCYNCRYRRWTAKSFICLRD